jgi:hypothetical protein
MRHRPRRCNRRNQSWCSIVVWLGNMLIRLFTSPYALSVWYKPADETIDQFECVFTLILVYIMSKYWSNPPTQHCLRSRAHWELHINMECSGRQATMATDQTATQLQASTYYDLRLWCRCDSPHGQSRPEYSPESCFKLYELSEKQARWAFKGEEAFDFRST